MGQTKLWHSCNKNSIPGNFADDAAGKGAQHSTAATGELTPDDGALCAKERSEQEVEW